MHIASTSKGGPQSPTRPIDLYPIIRVVGLLHWATLMRMTSSPHAPLADPLQRTKRKPSKGARVAALVITVLGGLFCVAGVIAAVSNSAKSGPPADRSLEGAAMCETFVKQQLKAPATARFSEETTTKVAEDEYATTGAVDSQNSFGALLRSHFRCDLTISTADNTWTSKAVAVTPG